MAGVSISSAHRSPTRGASQRVRTTPRRKPKPKTTRKYAAPHARTAVAAPSCLRCRCIKFERLIAGQSAVVGSAGPEVSAGRPGTDSRRGRSPSTPATRSPPPAHSPLRAAGPLRHVEAPAPPGRGDGEPSRRGDSGDSGLDRPQAQVNESRASRSLFVGEPAGKHRARAGGPSRSPGRRAAGSR